MHGLGLRLALGTVAAIAPARHYAALFGPRD
jgi:hypothetical protein